MTVYHRYWSADRFEFVEAGHLKPREQVQTLAGLKKVVSITPHASNETVYNLEVQGEHVYLVGSLGTLVHNDYPLFENGKYFERVFDVEDVGKVRVLADTVIDGKKLHLKDFIVYPDGADELELGTKRIVKYRNKIIDEARSAGFEELRITAERLTGAREGKKGKLVDLIIDLLK